MGSFPLRGRLFYTVGTGDESADEEFSLTGVNKACPQPGVPVLQESIHQIDNQRHQPGRSLEVRLHRVFLSFSCGGCDHQRGEQHLQYGPVRDLEGSPSLLVVFRLDRESRIVNVTNFCQREELLQHKQRVAFHQHLKEIVKRDSSKNLDSSLPDKPFGLESVVDGQLHMRRLYG